MTCLLWYKIEPLYCLSTTWFSYYCAITIMLNHCCRFSLMFDKFSFYKKKKIKNDKYYFTFLVFYLQIPVRICNILSFLFIKCILFVFYLCFIDFVLCIDLFVLFTQIGYRVIDAYYLSPCLSWRYLFFFSWNISLCLLWLYIIIYCFWL